jgi:amino acid transporter
MIVAKEDCKMSNEIKLKKKLSPLDVVSLALGCIVGGSCFILPGTSFLASGGPMGITIAMVVAAVVMSIIAFNYSFMVNRLPYSGGEFTYTNEAFGEKNAFVCAWFLSLSYISLVPLNATALGMVGRIFFNKMFQFGFHYSVAGYDIFLGEILLAYGALAIVAFFSIKGVRISGLFQTVLVLALVLGVGAIVFATIMNPNISFENLKPLFVPEKSNLSCILAILVVAPYCFVGFDTIPQAAEEFQFSPRKTKGIMVIAIIFGAFVYIAVNLITAVVVPDGYQSWIEYIEDLPNTEGLLSMPTFHAAYQLLGKGGLVFLGISVFSACLTGIIGFYMAASRLLYSMARENVIPKFFSRLTESNHTPKNAIVFIFTISLLGPVFGRTVLGWVVDMSSLGAAIGYGYTSAAAFKYAKKDGNKGIMVTGIIGIVMSIMFAVLLLVPLPGLNCSLSIPAYICLSVWTILGIIFYKKMHR